MRHGNRYPFDNFGARDNAPISWDEAVSIVRRAAIFLPTDFAVLATRPLQNTTITAADIRDLPLGFLRLLRNRDDLLDSAARCWLRSLVGTAHHLDAWEAAVVLERIVAISPVDLGLVRKNFRDQLSELEDPRDVIPSTYVLLGTGWTVP
jgi:hypothetical protein